MRIVYILILVFISITSFPTESYGQEEKEKTHIIFVNNLSAKDYYTLLAADPEIRLFTIEEVCIPLGFLAISYEKGYDENQSRNYTQTIILKLISRNASYTTYTIEDMRISCSEYRKKNSDE